VGPGELDHALKMVLETQRAGHTTAPSRVTKRGEVRNDKESRFCAKGNAKERQGSGERVKDESQLWLLHRGHKKGVQHQMEGCEGGEGRKNEKGLGPGTKKPKRYALSGFEAGTKEKPRGGTLEGGKGRGKRAHTGRRSRMN